MERCVICNKRLWDIFGVFWIPNVKTKNNPNKKVIYSLDGFESYLDKSGWEYYHEKCVKKYGIKID